MHQLDEKSSWTESPIRDATEIQLNLFASRKITTGFWICPLRIPLFCPSAALLAPPREPSLAARRFSLSLLWVVVVITMSVMTVEIACRP